MASECCSSIFLVMVSNAAFMAFSSALGYFGKNTIAICMTPQTGPRNCKAFAYFKYLLLSSIKSAMVPARSAVVCNTAAACSNLSLWPYWLGSYGSETIAATVVTFYWPTWTASVVTFVATTFCWPTGTATVVTFVATTESGCVTLELTRAGLDSGS